MPKKRIMREIELVIFDCDGVLVDSEMISASVIADVIRPLGIDMTTEEAYRQFVGGSMAATIQYVTDQIGRTPDFNIQERYRKLSFERYQQEMQPVEGVVEILENLKVKKCVGSNGPRSKINLNLEITQLNRFFSDDSIFSAYDIEKWKPEPDLYYLAASKMGVNPEQCLVVEDSINGMKAAATAGMTCFGISYPIKPLPRDIIGAEIFDHMSDIQAKMREIGII